MQKLDKKQMPQFVGLCVLSTGVFGYFVARMVTPSPAAAATRPVQKPTMAEPAAAATGTGASATGMAGTATKSLASGAAGSAAPPAAPPPAPGMRDPFVVGYSDPKAAAAPAAPPAFMAPPHGGPAPVTGPRVATAQIHEVPPAPVSGLTMPGFPAAPPAPPLPVSLSTLPPQKIMPLPAPPAPPKWSVTGLLQGEDGGGVAILRDGDSRRIVHVGDFVDGTFRVTSVTRSAVVLRHGAASYTLSLGAKSDSKPEAPAAPTFLPVPAAPEAPAPAAPALPRQSQTAPVPVRRLLTQTVAAAPPLRLLDGTEMVADAAPRQQIASRIR